MTTKARQAPDRECSRESVDMASSLLTAFLALDREAESPTADYHAVLGKIVERYVDSRVAAATREAQSLLRDVLHAWPRDRSATVPAFEAASEYLDDIDEEATR